ncbi:hypothetical protein JOL62DRAFT_114531 [Phyllosticta paracitricarpa]|uniref:RBR-type E3 ubiquitin transferase n=2 Tax=Phyllosticta TaxID=121621 RepID=A0ABR1MDS6_9PEZI
MDRYRFGPWPNSTEDEDAIAMSLHEAELHRFRASLALRYMNDNDSPLRRFTERGRRIGQPSVSGGQVTPSALMAMARDIRSLQRENNSLLARTIEAAREASRREREAQMARDAREAARLDARERARGLQIAQDREFARRLQHDNSFDEAFYPSYPDWLFTPERDGTPPFNITPSFNGTPPRKNNGIPAPSSTQRRRAATREPFPPAPTFDCTACTTAHPASDMAHLPCDHYYCSDCISRIFDGAITASISRLNPQPFLPECCRGHPIPYTAVANHLHGPTRQNFTRHATLLATPIEERTWCAGENCGRFIPPTTTSNGTNANVNTNRQNNNNNNNRNGRNKRSQDTLVRCPSCTLQTCTQCKRLSTDHMGGVGGLCPEDADVKALLLTAQQRGWQRCYRCENMVEKRSGCNHMTCTCGAQFCYVCGARWLGRHCDHGVFAGNDD